MKVQRCRGCKAENDLNSFPYAELLNSDMYRMEREGGDIEFMYKQLLNCYKEVMYVCQVCRKLNVVRKKNVQKIKTRTN